MMKKLFYTLPAMALILASCSSEIPGEESFGDGNVNFKISVPASFGTRAYGDGEFGDGLTAKYLQYAVYDIENDVNTLITKNTVMFEEEADNYKSTNVSLNLAKGRSYNIVFFAQEGTGAAGTLYEFDAAEHAATINVDYTKSEANSDKSDCFYAMEPTGVVAGPINKTITLRRPVAQINWGTDDTKEGAVTHATVYDKDDNGEVKNYSSKMTTKAYTTFDLLAGDVTGDEVDVTFDFAARPATTYTFPVTKEDATAEPYKYLRVAYLFVPKAQQLIDLKLEHSQDGVSPLAQVKVPGAPVQANYRTNIFGSLLTSPAIYNVTKDETFIIPGTDINLSGYGSYAKYTGVEGQDLQAMIQNGGIVEIAAPVDVIDLNYFGFKSANGDMAKAAVGTAENQEYHYLLQNKEAVRAAATGNPLMLIINAEVGTIKVKDFTEAQNVYVKVGKNVPYPAILNNTVTGRNGGPSVCANFTLEGDVNSSIKYARMNLYPDFGQGTDNVTIKNIAFDGEAIKQNAEATDATGYCAIYGRGVPHKNLKIEGCVFHDLYGPAIDSQKTVKEDWDAPKYQGNNHGDYSPSESIAVENCTINFASGAVSTASAIYILCNNNTIVKGNTINNAPYHGIFVRAYESALVEGNVVNGAGKEGIKIEGPQVDSNNTLVTTPKSFTVKDNSIKASRTGIRIAPFKGMAETAIVTGNTIFNTCGTAIMFESTDNYSSKIIVKANKLEGDFTGKTTLSIADTFTPLAGSDYTTPFE